MFAGIENACQQSGVSVLCAGVARGDSGCLVTAGGRVLTVVAVDDNLPSAVRKAQAAAEVVQFSGKTFRRDIAWRELR